jgi:hypothetical protein
MEEMSHSWDSITPLAEFNVISDDELSIINEDTEVLNNMVSISFSSMNAICTVEDIVLSTEISYEGDGSMVPGKDNTRYKGSLAL